MFGKVGGSVMDVPLLPRALKIISNVFFWFNLYYYTGLKQILEIVSNWRFSVVYLSVFCYPKFLPWGLLSSYIIDYFPWRAFVIADLVGAYVQRALVEGGGFCRSKGTVAANAFDQIASVVVTASADVGRRGAESLFD